MNRKPGVKPIALGALVTRDGINFIKRGKEKIAIMLL